MYGIVGVHASEFTNVRSLGGKGVQTKDSSPTISTQHAHSCLEVPEEVRPWRHRNHGEKNWLQSCVLALALRNYLQCGATTIVPDTNGSYNATYCLTNPTTVLVHPVSWSLSHVTSCFGVRTAHSNNKWSLVLWWLEKRLQPLRALTLHMFLHVRAWMLIKVREASIYKENRKRQSRNVVCPNNKCRHHWGSNGTGATLTRTGHDIGNPKKQ